MAVHDLSWRLRIAADPKSDPNGLGFVIAPGVALTCAHVVQDRTKWWVSPIGRPMIGGIAGTSWSPPVVKSRVPWTDVAMIAVPARLKTGLAPLGALDRPPAGSQLELFGFPRGFEAPGQWSSAEVRGPDASGLWLQMDGPIAQNGWVARGYSGGPAVERESGRVVGMVTWGMKVPRIAWLIPLDTIAVKIPLVGRLAAQGLDVDADFMAGKVHLDCGEYGSATTRFRRVMSRYRSNEVYFYWTLAALKGRRPLHHDQRSIDELISILSERVLCDPENAACSVLLAIVKDDAYVSAGMSVGNPSIADLMKALRRLSSERAREIVRHVPARGCSSWNAVREWGEKV